jgi:hypothetical protein
MPIESVCQTPTNAAHAPMRDGARLGRPRGLTRLALSSIVTSLGQVFLLQLRDWMQPGANTNLHVEFMTSAPLGCGSRHSENTNSIV